MTRPTLILTLLFGLTSALFFGQDNSIRKIRVSRGHVDKNGRLYQDRIYLDQIEFDLTTKTVLKRKNEASNFNLITNVSFPSMLNDTTTLNAVGRAYESYKSAACRTPTKNFFYKIDFLYCDKYPTYILTYEVPYDRLFSDNRKDENILEKIIDLYLELQDQK